MKKKWIPETDIAFNVRQAFDLEWKGLKPETSAPSAIYEIARGINDAKKRFASDINAQEDWMWAQREREEREVQHAYDQPWREDVEFAEAWDAHYTVK
jgi:hypothetical protein